MEILPILSDSYTLGFIGAGKMAESIAKGASRFGVLPLSRIVTAHSNPARRAAFESIGITVFSSNDDVVHSSNVVVFSVKPQLGISWVRSSNVVVLSVKPQLVKDVVLKLKPLLTKDKLLVSVAAGIKLKDLQCPGVVLKHIIRHVKRDETFFRSKAKWNCGTSKVVEPYKIDTRTTDIKLEILNLNRKEVISIDEISNQEFSEDECKRLRQSIKYGLSKRLTVGEILNKALTFQEIRVNDLLEAKKKFPQQVVRVIKSQ